MIITDIKKQVKDTERYSIYIDNKFVFGLSRVDVLYYRLKIGNEIPQEKYDEILENVIYEKAKNTAVKFLGYRARSKKELRDKLIKDYDENITDKVISMLEKYGYVNDEEYAKAYVRDCLNLKGWGQKRISLELTKRGIDKNIIEKALPKENTEQLELIEKLLTKRLKGNINIDFKEKKKHFDYQPAPKGDAVLDVKGLTALHPSGGYKLNDVTFTLSKGEVIGIYGLLGAGRTELFKGLVGLMPCQRGEVHLNGESIGKSRFQQRLKKGLALVPEDRQGEGVVQMMSIQANMTLSDFSLQGFRRAWRWLNPQKEESCVKEMIQQLAIKVSDATLPITSLSGGNQQKVVLGKALMTQPQVVFLDEPTRGIDVGAKTDVYHLIGKMAQQGLAVMFSSSELDEVMALADRILVMADGRITADLPRHAVTREQLIAASTPQD